MASKAMSTLKRPEFQEPTIPTREYWGDPEQTRRTKDRTRPGAKSTVVNNVLVLEDWEHGLAVEQYKADRKIYNKQVMAWKENKAKCYYLVLSHCPRALEHQLKNSTKWDETESNQDVVALLQMIRDITHNKKERKESVMAIVESDLELYTIAQDPGESLDEYYKVFLAQVDTIDAHGGNAGYHPVIYTAHMETTLQKKGKTRDEYDAMDEESRTAIQSEVIKAAKEAYLACLFIQLADDKRYGDVKRALADNYLLGKQEYPQDLLAAKRLLADYKGVPGKATKAADAADEQGVAFAEGG